MSLVITLMRLQIASAGFIRLKTFSFGGGEGGGGWDKWASEEDVWDRII